MVQSGPEDEVVEPGVTVLFDCHGTVDLYCWDGGKTWVADGEPAGATKRNAEATARAAETLLDAMRPGARVSELQARAREAYRKAGLPNPDDAVIFFHGLGLSHMDLEQSSADGKPNGDWKLEEGMVVPMHLLVPGGERERYWLEEVVVVGKANGRPLFSWPSFIPISLRNVSRQARGASNGMSPSTTSTSASAAQSVSATPRRTTSRAPGRDLRARRSGGST